MGDRAVRVAFNLVLLIVASILERKAAALCLWIPYPGPAHWLQTVWCCYQVVFDGPLEHLLGLRTLQTVHSSRRLDSQMALGGRGHTPL